MADSLKAFFAESALKADEVEYVASKRFLDGDRKPIAWKIKPITQEEYAGMKPAEVAVLVKQRIQEKLDECLAEK